jgi:hypothetical protein
LWLLDHNGESVPARERRPDSFRFMSDHDGGCPGAEWGGRVEDAVDHRPPSDAVEDLRPRGFHSRAFSGREDDDVDVQRC